MPLLERKIFKREKLPKDFDPNEEMFYCKATNELFRQYEQFFERVILCNSLVWSCTMTGKSNLTYQEAVESEENSRKSLKTFPLALKKPLLYLTSLTSEKRLNDLCDKVFNFVKERYFVGEEVEAMINGIKRSCEVTQVVLPERATPKTPAKNENKQSKPKDIAPAKIKYEVVDYNSGKSSVVKAENISRPKGTYNKPRNKLFLKHHTQMRNGAFKVKETSVSVNHLQEFQFNEVYPGPLPGFVVIEKPSDKKDKSAPRKKIVQGKLNFKKESMDERRKNLEKMALTEKQKTAAEKERQKVKDNLKKQMEDEKLKQKEEKLKEKEKKKEEKKIIAAYLNNWKKPRDDLECDDLKDLPAPTPVDCGIPQDHFGDALMILEFLNTFSKQMQLKDIFPHGITFELIEKALVDTDIEGVLNDLLQLFLTTLFRYQEADDYTADIKNRKMTGLDNLDIDQAMNVAAITSTWPQKYHGTQLRNIPLDSFCITEVLRLHLLASGARPRISWQGVITPSEDPGLYFKMEEAELLKKLEKVSVFELSCEERCKILSVLMNQLLCSDVFKIAIDESADSTKPLRNQLRELRLNFARKQKEDTNVKKKDTEKKDEVNKENGSAENPPSVDEEEKENSEKKDLTPEEKEALEEKKAKETARLKSDFQRKEREMESQLRKLQLSFNVIPIGRDRAFRRYWAYQTVAGIFVEDDDAYKGVCLPKPVPQLHNVVTAAAKAESSASIKKYLQTDSKNGSSDKENEILRDIAIVQSELPFPLKNRKLSDLNSRLDSKKSTVDNSIPEIETCLLCVNKSDNQGNYIKYCPHSKANLASDQCSGNIDTCPVHNINAPRTKWAFYYKEEDLDALINSLNSRGFRERSLKDALLNEKERIQELLSKCPANSFNRTLPPQTEPRKSQRLQNSYNSSYAGMRPQDALDLTLRDMILELEQRIYAGGLGNLKVPDREAWRAAIEQGANKNICASDKIKDEERTLKDDIESDILKLSLPIPPEKLVKDLATALLELSQGIEAKYLNSPLGESEEQKKARMKQDDEPQQKKKKSVPHLESWQESLMQCANTSQLFVHLGTLERSVAWSRSVLKAHCRICRRRGDAENMLLCDGCNRGHHIYCLKPPLKAIPEGDWFCVSCRPIEVPTTPTKKSRRAEESEEEEDDDEEEEDEEEEEEGSEDEEEEDENDDENESEEEVEDEEDGEAESEDDSSVVQEQCEVCGDVGTLLCCDGCPLMYHAECVNLRRIPRGEWLCPKCTKKEEAAKASRKNSSNGSYGTRSSKQTEKKSNPSLKTKIGTKASKRKYEDSFEEEFEPPAKRANNRNSAQNAARRRSKTGGDSEMLDYKACIDMLVELMKHPSSWPFLVPVNKKDAPGYHQKIKKPMDFGTIRSNLNCMKYKNNQEVVQDLRLVLDNCWTFNPKSSPEYKAASVLQKEIKRLLKDYEIGDAPAFNGHSPYGKDS